MPQAPSLGGLVTSWIEAHCVIPDGFDRGKPFILYDEQLRYEDAFYRIKPDAEVGQLAAAFVYRRGLLVRPQKWGKGPLIAADICAQGVGPALFNGWAIGGEIYDCRDFGCGCGFRYEYEPGEPTGTPWPTPLIQITALSEEQTDNIYGALRPMIEYGPLAEVIPRMGEEFIRLPGGGRIDTVTSSAQSRLGQRVTYVAQDEVGLWTPTNKMTKVADTQYRGLAGMGGRANLTTNGWDPSEQSVAQQQYESPAQDVLRDFKQPPANLSYGDKRERRKIHKHVYGDSLKDRGGHIDLDAIEAEAADLVHRDIAQAQRFFGNMIVYGSGAWMDGDVWDSRKRSNFFGEQFGRRRPTDAPISVVGGFDGSDTDDWTVIRLQTQDGYQFTPRYGPDRQPCIWDPNQHRGQVPRLEVHAAWQEISQTYNLVRVYCDPPGWKTEIDQWAEEYGDEIFIRWETYRINQMHAALLRFHTDVVKMDTTFTHDGDPIIATHVRNARKLARPNQKYILGKPSQQQKIDGAMSSVLANECAGDVTATGSWPAQVDNLIYTASSTRWG
jgi:hypothetical protein